MKELAGPTLEERYSAELGREKAGRVGFETW